MFVKEMESLRGSKKCNALVVAVEHSTPFPLLVCCWFVAFVCRDTLLNDLEHSAWYGI